MPKIVLIFGEDISNLGSQIDVKWKNDFKWNDRPLSQMTLLALLVY